MLFKRNNRKKVGIREKTASFVSQRQDGLEAVKEDVLEMLQGDLHRLKATFGGADISLDE